MFLAAAIRFVTRTGTSAPSGIWNGRVRQLAPTSSSPARWMSIGYQPTPTESTKCAARGPGWKCADTSCSTHRGQRDDAARLANVGVLGEPVGAAHRVGPQLQLGCAARVAGGRCFGLQPVQEAEADALRVLQRGCGLRGGAVDDALVAVVVAGPVDHRQVVRRQRSDEVRREQAAIGPEAALGAGHLLVELVCQAAALLAVDLAAVDVDGQRVGLRGPVVRVLLGLGDDVALPGGPALEGEGVGEALHAARLGFVRLSVRFAGGRAIDSAPTRYSAPDSGSRSPSSVASMTRRGWKRMRRRAIEAHAPAASGCDRRSSSMARSCVRRNTLRRPLATCGASRSRIWLGADRAARTRAG